MLRHLGDITQDMRRIRILILTQGAALNGEAAEEEQLLAKDGYVPLVKLSHEDLTDKLRIARILVAILDICHATYEVFLRDAKSLADTHSIKVFLCFAHHHHYVVGWLVEHEQLAIAIIDDTSSGVVNLLQKGIGVGTLTVVLAHHLEGEETQDIDNDNQHCRTSDDVFTVREVGEQNK